MKGILSDSELSMVCKLIATSMGLNFPGERWPMLSRNLASAAREFGYNNINGFVQWLLSAPLNKEQMELLAAHLTVSETYFWREPQVFKALTDYVLPELIKSKKKGEKSIRIWSAGCSTGEEPYSIAIALHKMIQKIEDWNITILATDINPKALSKAVTGIYGAWSFRNSPAWLKSTYFHHKEDRQYEIIPEIKKMVTFTCLSLVEMTAISNINIMDIIFCRNVLMYFTPEWMNRISRNLFNSLSEDGWFVVSSSELSSHVFPQFTPVNFPGAILYRKTKKQSVQSFNICPSSSDTVESSSLHRAQSEVLAKKDLQLFNFSTLHPLKSPSTPVNPLKHLSSEALAKVERKSYEKAPEESYADKISAIRVLANQGYLAEALSVCDKTITIYKLAPVLYFLRASILQELDKSHEAIKSLKQAIYIDPDYIMGHFTLGNLFIRQGNLKNAKRYFNNALELLNTVSNDNIPGESEGLSAKYIKEIILTSLQTQESV